MLNEDKIKLMTRLSFKEKREKEEIYIASTYFKKDYIAKYMLKAFFGFSVSYIVIVTILILYSLESILGIADINIVINMFRNYILFYFPGLILYEIINYNFYSNKYDISEKANKEYRSELLKLEKRYDFQTRNKELTKEVEK